MTRRISPVTGTELSAYVSRFEVELCGQFGKGFHASIKYDVGGDLYRVYDHDAVIAETADPEGAARAYNQIRPR